MFCQSINYLRYVSVKTPKCLSENKKNCPMGFASNAQFSKAFSDGLVIGDIFAIQNWLEFW